MRLGRLSFNDINGDLVTLYRCVRYHLDELLKEITWTLNSHEEFDDFKQHPGLTDIQRSARWFVRNKLGFGGLGQHFGRSSKGGGVSHASRENRITALRELNQRLDRVCVENLAWRDCLSKYDTPSTAFFLDPPYTKGYGYERPWQEKDHQELRQALSTLAGSWVLTYDYSPLILKLYEGCEMEVVERTLGINNKPGKPRRTIREVIITPIRASAEAALYSSDTTGL